MSKFLNQKPSMRKKENIAAFPKCPRSTLFGALKKTCPTYLTCDALDFWGNYCATSGKI